MYQCGNRGTYSNHITWAIESYYDKGIVVTAFLCKPFVPILPSLLAAFNTKHIYEDPSYMGLS